MKQDKIPLIKGAFQYTDQRSHPGRFYSKALVDHAAAIWLATKTAKTKPASRGELLQKGLDEVVLE